MKKLIGVFILFVCIRLDAQVLIKDVYPGVQSGVMSSQNVVFDNKLWILGRGANNSDVWYSSDGIHWIQATDNDS